MQDKMNVKIFNKYIFRKCDKIKVLENDRKIDTIFTNGLKSD